MKKYAALITEILFIFGTSIALAFHTISPLYGFLLYVIGFIALDIRLKSTN